MGGFVLGVFVLGVFGLGGFVWGVLSWGFLTWGVLSVHRIFCSRKHQSKHCDIVSNPETRKNILAKEKRCFVCMKFGHIASKCRNDLKCYKCKGRHHVAVCTFKSERRNHYEPENSHTAVAGSKVLNLSKSNSILLQTARAQVRWVTSAEH